MQISVQIHLCPFFIHPGNELFDLFRGKQTKKEILPYPICSVVAVLGAVALRDVHHVRTTYVETNDISRQYNDKFIMYSDRACGIILSSLTASRRQYQNKPRPSDLSLLIPPKNYWIHSRGAKIQKIKRIDHSKCNVRASKNAEQAFSTQWYLYSGYGLIVLFSSVP